ncbi:PREDICTED: uncharacterized protein LOC104813102 [Tarenaya hassleriana]|uniref:uncharacterized protein LOC104813102 n=1 Tax=Tarenaya hassleriana TaxID=28532 RepID=UPI00053C658C|nr:PREDICTED: uncharacterized protein LOC104813102 [Tarenaya hassleriana]
MRIIMGKGQRLTNSRSERFLGTHSYSNRHVDAASSADPELMEEDVWSVTEHDSDRYHVGAWNSRATAPTPSWGLKPAGRHHVGIPDASERDGGGRIQMSASAPVSVPNWGKILRVDSADPLGSDWDDDVAETDGDMVPPHEWVARERRNGGASVFVGVGRTLKGRDMSRVRDSVWSQIGFDG